MARSSRSSQTDSSNGGDSQPTEAPEPQEQAYQPKPDELQVGEKVIQKIGDERRELVVDHYRPDGVVVMRRPQGTTFTATWKTQADLDAHLEGKFPGRYLRESVAQEREAQAEEAAKAEAAKAEQEAEQAA